MLARDFQTTSGSLQQQIAAVDDFIATLGDAGALYAERLRKAEIKWAPVDKLFGFFAYYDPVLNQFHCREDLLFPLLFNLRVHEGTHAFQVEALPYLRAVLRNMAFGAPVATVSLVDMLRFRRVMEAGACTAHTYFNTLAFQKTRQGLFLSCMAGPPLGHNMLSLVELQLSLLEKGQSADVIKERVAAAFLDLEVLEEEGVITQKDSSDKAVMHAIKQVPMLFARDNVVTMSDLRVLLNAGVPLASSEAALASCRGPIQVIPSVRQAIQRLGLAL